jgi:hypothetical protein
LTFAVGRSNPSAGSHPYGSGSGIDVSLSIRIRILLLILIVIRIPILIKVMRIGNLWHSSLYVSILSLYVSTVSVQGHPWHHFKPLQLLNYEFDADSDPAF